MSVGRLLAATIGLLLALAVLGIGLALSANEQLNRDRRFLLDEVGPARRAALDLENALINEETGVRGYLITGEPSFLAPYTDGRQREEQAYAEVRVRERAIGSEAASEVELVRARAQAWRREFVAVELAQVRRLAVPPMVAQAGGTAPAARPQPARRLAAEVEGKRLFDSVRASLARLQTTLTRRDVATRAQLNSSAARLQLLLIVAAALIVGGILAAGLLLRRTITRPLARLGQEARRVAGGEFERPLAVAASPREVAEVGAEIDAMRERIVAELASVEAAHARLKAQAGELRRSNAELEQFAYVASHDLQEPLRKIANFCQALQVRYRGQLDERADEYIEFAVDGAQRMQMMINELLAFSRVGRGGREDELVELDEVLAAAESALAQALRESGASVIAQELPAVRGDRTQLISLFQNLLGNAVKFRGEQAPVVRITAERTGADEGRGASDGAGEEWRLSFADNGIGIEAEYAERIFLIFQRLHSREAYAGSGIGLALCRKIVEYHGGRIWLDTEYSNGACFKMTLPIAKESGH